ncbi:hypothetical protein I2494_17805 [Budviciaceae bacterium BWR-B9]|uniref:Conjugal transfer protein TrbF n=1 Tax=Limnobaculum allomyrinae TaxID=2791986 RepID=A0ABS1IUV5_9GAMM|nr:MULTISPECIES: hypothetical protein [Limnobaculum]MBK5145537.1 hypothetical protein [Limnobaculum allomyrinae]MBV7693656.1 hypothetical protein [Limnobaculum sp. M2-1]
MENQYTKRLDNTLEIKKFEDKTLWVLFVVGMVLTVSGVLTYEAISYVFHFTVSAYDDGELKKASINEQVAFAMLNTSYYVISISLFAIGLSCWLVCAYLWLGDKCEILFKKIRNKLRGKYEA